MKITIRPEVIATSRNRDFCAYLAVKMCLNCWLASMKIETETILKQSISVIENVQLKLFSPIFGFSDKYRPRNWNELERMNTHSVYSYIDEK